ncbi:formate dehydrogenase accessory protein FdhE [Paraeggerthella sp.]|uniref:formate dehydrogenase accessory protein FdhE domain-containing protein n=1 Tax=Paraeggerthella sp. TaxID=2897350 RepID=UPI003527D5F8
MTAWTKIPLALGRWLHPWRCARCSAGRRPRSVPRCARRARPNRIRCAARCAAAPLRWRAWETFRQCRAAAKSCGAASGGTAWDFERVRCARCGTQNQAHLHYFNVEGDDAHRIATCDECGGYVRTVYQEDVLAPFSFEVEDVVMARLDLIAYQQANAQAAGNR